MDKEMLRMEITTGVTKLSLLKLNFGPPPETMQFTDDLWFETLEGEFPKGANIEVPRIRTAFKTLMKTFSNWPAPADLIKALPNYPTQFYIAEEFPCDEVCERGKAAIRNIVDNILAED